MINHFPSSPEMHRAAAMAELHQAQTALALMGLADLLQSQIPESPVAPERLGALLHCLAERMAAALDV